MPNMSRLLRAIIFFWCAELCLGYGDISVSGIRLEGGTGPFEGRVEVKINGVWGTICQNNFDMDEAKVLCRMMNLSATAYFTEAYYGHGIGPIFVGSLHCNGYEAHIDQCYFQPNFGCTHSHDVSIMCTGCGEVHGFINPVSVSPDGKNLSATCNTTNTDESLSLQCDSNGDWSTAGFKCPEVDGIRLADGIGLYDGRVEVMVNGNWGTICNRFFTEREARVICNMFGLSYQNYFSYWQNNNNRTVHIDQVNCFGNESHLNDCTFRYADQCRHYDDVSVVCKNSSLNFTNIRLTNGTGPNHGRVELEASTTWGTLCRDNYIDRNALGTLCKMLNLNYTLHSTITQHLEHPPPQLMYSLYCNSDVDDINRCTYSVASKNYCNSYSFLWLLCTDCGVPYVANGSVLSSNYSSSTVNAQCNAGYKPSRLTLTCLENGTWLADQTCTPIPFPLNITSIRLSNGWHKYHGRVEILVDNSWGTICSSDFGYEEAEVICRMLGYNYKDYYRSGDSSNAAIDSLNCTGNEPHINNCSYTIQHSCNGYRDKVWVLCAGEQHIISSVRLAGAPGPYQGRVEIEVNNTWGTICGYHFDSRGAETVCQTQGLRHYQYKSYYGQESGPTYIKGLYCGGVQKPIKQDINECSYLPSSTCEYSQSAASVTCYGPQLNITDVRLVNGSGPYDGRAEIEVDGVWGTMCNSYFDDYSADAFCRMFGLSGGRRLAESAQGEGSGPIYIDQLFCNWYEYRNLSQCPYLFLNSCRHDMDVSVACYGPPLNITNVRLANGTSPYDGRAEIQVNGVWGTICDRNFAINDGDYFCRMLDSRLRAAHYYTGSTYGEGTGPIYIDELFCNNYPYELSQCNYFTMNSCSHARDVSVVCSECGRPDLNYWDVGFFRFNGTSLYADCAYYKTYVGTLQMTCDNSTWYYTRWITEGECHEYKFPLDITDMRLVGGKAESNGRVELKTLNTWGTVCDHFFGINEANAICAMIGYWPATAFYTGAHFGQGSGPIFVDDLNCTSDARHINNCTYVTYDNCEHSNDVSLVCNDCGDPTPHNGTARYNGTFYGASAELSCNDGFKLIGESIIKCELNHTWSYQTYCKLIDCKSPIPVNGFANSSLTTNGTVVAISCNEGYNISGNGIITCMENETWSDKPICIIIDCGYPKPGNADIHLSTNETTFQSQVVVNCITGYQPDGSWTLSCQANGSWEAWPECTIKDCGDPTPSRGYVNDTTTVYGTVVEVTCNEGYNISGESVIICQEDGTWSDYPTCDSSDCGRPSVSNGVAELDNGNTSVGSVAHITCNTGYELVGPSSLVCTWSGWNDTVSCVEQDCGDPTPVNGRAEFDGTKFGDRATISCNVGYSLIGDSVITCQAGSKWSGSPFCKLIDCGNPEVPANGNMDNSSGTVYNSTVTFTCNNGYLLVGTQSIVCMKNGTWSSASPTCAKKGAIGESCISDEYCSTVDATCRNKLCRCSTGIHDEMANKCNIMPLFPYGQEANDVQFSGKDLCSDTISFPPGIPVNGKQHKDLYVCVNGLISFDNKYTNPIPPKDKDTAEADLANRIIFAPFYAQVNVSTGNLFYRTYDILNTFSKMQTDSSTIDFIENLAKQFGNVDGFEASFVLIATWEKVRTSQPDYDNARDSTFQLVLTSDGKSTLVMFIYGHKQMLWQKTSNSPTRVFVGHSTGQNMLYIHPFSYFPVVLGMDFTKTADPTSGEAVAGIVFQIISKAEDKTTNYAVDCINWYNKYLPEKRQNDMFNSWLPSCPCDIWLSRIDPWFWNVNRSSLHRYTCVDMVPGIIYKPYGKSCCFNNSLWIDNRPRAGGFYRYHPLNDIKNHHLHDIDPKRTCCELSNYCKLYYDLRPTGACYRTSPYNFGVFWGDPHFRTLDGANFTFNGLGEYTLLRIKNENVSFELQTRTARAVKADGSLSDATMFSAFAAMDNFNASFHAELNRAKDGINLYVNGRDITTRYYTHSDLEMPFTYMPDENNIAISKRGDTLNVLFQAIGVSLNVSVSSQMLSLNTIVPDKYRNATSGLLGNYNNVSDDDFALPNGTSLSANMTEREIFKYAILWSINPNMSAFVYEDGKSHEDYHNESYIPRFLDEVDPEKRKEAERVCNGSHNIECVFDFVFTEKPEVAEDSNRIRQQADSTQEELDVSIPNLQGCAEVNATNSSVVTCQLTMDGDYSVRFIENTARAIYNSTAHTISFFQETADPVAISVVAMNKKGRSSPPFVVSVLLCTGCSGHGVCTDKIREDPKETEYYKYLTCRCDPQYEGLDCEHVFNGCKANPCSLGRNCTSLSVAEQKEHNLTYKCGPCPVGYQSRDGFNVICQDVDECNEPGICDHNCSNTDGSYQCNCRAGYRTDSRNPNKCQDIHECNELLHNCTQICTNLNGGFECDCKEGFKFNVSSWSCDQFGDMACSNKDKCSHTHGCMRHNDSDVCICNSGYELYETEANRTCADIDECKQNVCPQLCNNTHGGFTCLCFDGYKLEDKTTCKECEMPYWGFNCSNRCDCTGQGALKCDPVKGCLCKGGWSGETCNDNIDECRSDSNICKDPRKTCIDTIGSFICRCREGYRETINGSCEDLNECSNPLLHDCEQQCTNTIGGYSCSCLPGYKRYNNTACEDIDECALGTAGCEQVCQNNPGLYSCFCHFGYTLNDDRKTCEKLSDPCKTINNLECSHFCHVSANQASCQCRKGFQLGTDFQTCIDINECQDNMANLCDRRANCINTEGSFECKCPSGTQLENDGRTCTDCDAFHYGENCAKECTCLNGLCNKTQGCVCDLGWSGNGCDIDIDECKSGQLNCTFNNSECRNTPGSAVCTCLPGYHNATGYCEDVDECSNVNWNICDQQCVNLPGSYKCACQTGFLFTAGKCSDIDECSLNNDKCEQVCDNTVGSYRCSCEAGFRLDLTDRRSCIADYECSVLDKEECGQNATCFMDKGNATCRCKKGFNKDNDECIDIDECIQQQRPCEQLCNNYVGSFVCGCNSGYVLQDDNFFCKECDSWNYGKNCANNCTCSTANTKNCNHTTGHCQCKDGWSNTTCSTDIDECQMNTSNCPEHSACRNTVGHYECDCDRGYIKTGSGECHECTNNKYGDSCKYDCQCDRVNSETCDHVTGICTCTKGWTGALCTQDVDECTNSSICHIKQNSTCKNTNGSYTCSCNQGFTEEANTCKDVNECLTNKHDCNQKCVNTVGKYKCECWPGFYGTNNNCTACSSNQYGENCTGRCNCIIANSANKTQTCNRETGKCECSPNWTGDTCSQDVDECLNQNDCPDNENKGCRNTDGWYKCECYKGYIELKNGTCAIDKADKLNLKLTIKDVDFSEKHITENYVVLKHEVEQSLKKFYRNYSKDPLQIRVNNITKGSLIVSYQVIYDKEDTSLASAITKALSDQGKGIASLSFYGKTYNITADNYKDAPCEIYRKYFGPCKDDLECQVENETPVCRQKLNTSSDLNLPLVIGLSVGGFVLLVIVTIATICIWKRSHQDAHKGQFKNESSEYADIVKGQSYYSDYSSIGQWLRKVGTSEDGKYLTWKSMLSRSSRRENVYDSPFQIPRARTGMSPFAAGDSANYVHDEM